MRKIFLCFITITTIFLGGCVEDEFGGNAEYSTNFNFHFVDKSLVASSTVDSVMLFNGNVSVIHNGETITKKVEKAETVSFSKLDRGQYVFTFRIDGYSPMNMTIATSDGGGEQSLKDIVFSLEAPLLNISRSIIEGVVNYQKKVNTAVSNTVAEALPAGYEFMSVSIDKESELFINQFLKRQTSAGYTAQIVSLNYLTSEVVIQTSLENTTGYYSINLPASVGGLDYKVQFYDMTLPQTIIQGSTTVVQNKIFSPYNKDFTVNNDTINYSEGSYRINLKAGEVKRMNIYFGQGK